MQIVLNALNYAAKAHAGQFRKYGDPPIPYIVHPMRVMVLAQGYGFDTDFLAAALLHDTVEDTWVTLEDISVVTNDVVTDIVRQLTNPSKDLEHKNKSRAERKKIDRDHISKAWPTVKGLKLLDRLDNLSDMEHGAPKDFLSLYIKESWQLLDAVTNHGHYNRKIAEALEDKLKALDKTISAC